MTIIIFIIVLLVTVTVHEWGHYIAAKKSGMRVDEFGFGIPPRLFSWKRGETRYSINALPIGGFVKIAGENGLDGDAPVSRQFESKPWYLKSIVLVAGVMCNMLLAFVLFTAAYMVGMPTIVEKGGIPTVVQVVPGSPADAAGLTVGDTITAVSVGSTAVEAINTESLRSAIVASDEPVSIAYVHAGTSATATVEPDGADRKIGIAIEPVARVQLSLWQAVRVSLIQTINTAAGIFTTLGTLIGSLFTGASSGIELMGPVGLAREVGGAATIGLTYLIAFTAAISVNLAVLNILPFPGLDGGRLLIVLLEAVTRRKFSQTVVNTIHAVGFLLLIVLMVYLTVGDIWGL